MPATLGVEVVSARAARAGTAGGRGGGGAVGVAGERVAVVEVADLGAAVATGGAASACGADVGGEGGGWGVNGGAVAEQHHNWTRAQADDGVVVADLPPSDRPPLVHARVRDGGEEIYRDQVIGDWQPPAGWSPRIPRSVLVEATRQTRGDAVDPGFLRSMLDDVLSDAGLSIEDRLTIRVPWSGRVADRDALLLTVQPEDGGVLAYGWSRRFDGIRQDLRLLLPAQGVTTRPIAWRVESEESKASTSTVMVVAPEGAVSAELVTERGVEPVELDASGAGQGSVEAEQRATVRAYGADGELLGETPVPLLKGEWHLGVPGDKPETRVVP